ncbi:MAG: transposase, partial [Lachnospiraceae bacterium]|nr:transposase [Lachnospiraceae bacterium]
MGPLGKIIRPYYPSGKRGRPPKAIESMLRMYLMQNWSNLSDAGIEDALCDGYSSQNMPHRPP